MITIDTWEKKTPERQKSTKFLKRVKPKCFEKQKESQGAWSFLGAEEDEVKGTMIGSNSAFVWEKKRSALIQTLLYCGEECELVWPLWQTVWSFLQKPKPELPYDQQPHSWTYTLRKPEFTKAHAPQCSLQHYYDGQDTDTT